MFPKLAFVIVALGACACGLLLARQQRLQAVHELAEIQRRVTHHDRALYRLRTEVAARLTPPQIRQLAARVTPLQPLALDRPPEPPILTADAPAAGVSARHLQR